MKYTALIAIALLSVFLGACQTTSGSRPVVQAASKEQKQATLDRVKSLQGTWKVSDPNAAESGQTTFTVGGGGSTVREVMFPGSQHEMTNMYHMDGPSIVCTHYCAAGNQPRMVASGANGDTIMFKLDRVSNLRKPNEEYMGEMWLTFKGPDLVEQRWKSFKGNEVVSESVFTLTRIN